MSDFFGHVAGAALPVAITLLVLTAAARAMLSAKLEGDEGRIARQHLEPLSTWCLIAAGTYALAIGAAGKAAVLPLAAAIAMAVAAVLLRSEDRPSEERVEPEPDVRRSPAPETLGPETGGRRAFPEAVPTHGRTPEPTQPAHSLWVDEESGPRQGLWAR